MQRKGVDWKARCIETRKALDKERKDTIALLKKIDLWAEYIDIEIDEQNFGMAASFCQHIRNAVRDSGYAEVARCTK